MSKWYKVGTYGIEITPVEFVSQTEKYVVIMDDYYKSPVRRFKANEYFPTFEEARQYLFGRLAAKCDQRRRELEELRTQLVVVFCMEEPKET